MTIKIMEDKRLNVLEAIVNDFLNDNIGYKLHTSGIRSIEDRYGDIEKFYCVLVDETHDIY